MENKYIVNIQLLRGLASLSVCLIHMKVISNLQVSPQFDFIFIFLQLGVQIFFIISAFILPYSLMKKEYKIGQFFKFLYKRLIRIDPPFWIIVLIYALVLKDTNYIQLDRLVYNLFYLVPFIGDTSWYSAIFWTLGIEFQFYLILGLTFTLLISLATKYQIVLLVALFQLVFLLNFGYERDFIISNLYYFIIGFLAFLGFTKPGQKNLIFIVITFLSIELGALIAIRFGLITLATSSILLFAPSLKNKITDSLGKISYSLYLTHLLIGTLLFNFFMNLTAPILFSIQVVCCILFAGLFYHFVERPFQIWSKKVNLR